MVITKKQLNKHMNELIELDSQFPDAWNKKNFLMDLPSKLKYSRLIFHTTNLIAYMICSKKEDYIHIHRICVREGFRGMGLGKNLLDSLPNKVSLCVDINNSAAFDFYVANGFTTTHCLMRKEK